MDIGNYHFFVTKKKFLIYDYQNNLLYSPKRSVDYFELQSVLTEKLKKKKNEEKNCSKYLPFLENFVNNVTSFDSARLISQSQIVSSKITLMVSQDCNLKCSYCYGDEGRFGPTANMMTKETAEHAVRFFVERARPFNFKYLFISFLGGEPLMNFGLMKHIIEFNKIEFPDISFSYTFTTNATLFTKQKIEYFKKQDISILISLDGTKEIHDKNRIFKDGSGSFDKVIEKILLLKENNIQFSVRATLSHEDFKNYEKIIKYFNKIGVQQIFISRLSKYDTDSELFDINVEELEKDICIVDSFHDKTHKRILKGFNPKYVPFITMFERIHDANDSPIACGIMKGTTAVSCDGKLYPCHRFVGIKGFDFGSISDGINDKAVNKIANNLDASTIKCTVCWAKYLCKRGCVRDIAKANGTFTHYDEKFCELMQKSIEKALITYFHIVKNRPDYLKEFSNKEIEVYNVV